MYESHGNRAFVYVGSVHPTFRENAGNSFLSSDLFVLRETNRFHRLTSISSKFFGCPNCSTFTSIPRTSASTDIGYPRSNSVTAFTFVLFLEPTPTFIRICYLNTTSTLHHPKAGTGRRGIGERDAPLGLGALLPMQGFPADNPKSLPPLRRSRMH